MDGLGSGEEQAEAKAFVAQAFADRCWQTAPVRAPQLPLAATAPLFSS
eukprot:COSAG04_NODE_22156_length_360_cov_0.900383_1_plen_48_part_00